MRLVAFLMWDFCADDKILKLFPEKHIIRESFPFQSLSLFIFNEENTDEEVEEEETSNQNKDDEEARLRG